MFNQLENEIRDHWVRRLPGFDLLPGINYTEKEFAFTFIRIPWLVYLSYNCEGFVSKINETLSSERLVISYTPTGVYPAQAQLQEATYYVGPHGYDSGKANEYVSLLVTLCNSDPADLPIYMGIQPIFDRYIEERLNNAI